MSIFTRNEPQLRPDLQALVSIYPRAGFYGHIWKQLDAALDPAEDLQAVAAGATGVALTDRRIIQVRGRGRYQDVLVVGLDQVRMVAVDGRGTTAAVTIHTDGPSIVVKTVLRDRAAVFASHVRDAVGL